EEFPALELRELVELGFYVHVLFRDPVADRFACLRLIDLSDEQALHLAQDLLVHALRTLRNQHRADPVIAPEPHDPLHPLQHSLHWPTELLRSEQLSFLEHDHSRLALTLAAESKGL